jgi:hypothetical protein
MDTGKAQYVQIQFAPGGSNSYQTVKTVRISNPYGYFDTQVKFPGSGSVRLSWTYPSGDSGLSNPLASYVGGGSQIYSRVTGIRLH